MPSPFARFVLAVGLYVGLAPFFSIAHADALAAPKPVKAAVAAEAKAPKSPLVTFETTAGNIVVRLDAQRAPISTSNLLAYVNAGFYDGTVFHRVIADFMIQGGGFTAELKQKPTQKAIKNEADNGLTNKRGTLAMARTSEVDSATAQFFINTKDNPMLDHSPTSFGYAVVGEVVLGMDVVDKIRRSEVLCPSNGAAACQAPLPPGMGDVPKKAIVIRKAWAK